MQDVDITKAYKDMKDEFIKTLWLLERSSKALKTSLTAIKAFRAEVIDPIINEGESILFETEKAFKVRDTFKEETHAQ